jgi:hypothetical protein
VLVVGVPPEGVDVGAAGQVVGRHEPERPGAEQPLAVQFAAAYEHGREPVVVRRRRHQSGDAAAGGELRGLAEGGPQFLVHGEAARVGFRAVDLREVRHTLGREGERRVGHAERAEHVRLHERVEALAGANLDDPARHVKGEGVVPRGARFEQQRQSAYFGAHLLKCRAR